MIDYSRNICNYMFLRYGANMKHKTAIDRHWDCPLVFDWSRSNSIGLPALSCDRCEYHRGRRQFVKWPNKQEWALRHQLNIPHVNLNF